VVIIADWFHEVGVESGLARPPTLTWMLRCAGYRLILDALHAALRWLGSTLA
jgi:hypothetical protein